MKNCDKFKDLIEKYLDGMIAEDELSELQKHTEACPSCRAEFERSTFMEDAVRQAFTSQTSAEDAGTSLMDRLSSEPDRMPYPRQAVVLFTGMRAAVAAGILLTAGMFLGFALDRSDEPPAEPLRTEVPIHIGDIEVQPFGNYLALDTLDCTHKASRQVLEAVDDVRLLVGVGTRCAEPEALQVSGKLQRIDDCGCERLALKG